MKIIFIILLSITYLFSLDISGQYDGFYKYFDKNKGNIIGNFTIDIKQNGNNIYGVIKEPRTTFGPQQPYLFSDFEGKLSGDENSFSLQYVKRYRYKKSHTVNYQGNFKNYSGELTGIWNIGKYKGEFKIFGITPKEEFDMEAPKVLITNPFVQLVGNSTKRALKIVKSKSVTIEGIASDNIKIESITINGENAYLQEPTLDEKSLIVGNSVKFSLPLKNISKNKQYHLIATDINGNKKEFTFKVDSTSSKATQNTEQNDNKYRNKYAVLIGINGYTYWPGLEFAVNDAKVLERHLKKLGYKTITLFDKEATRGNILKTLGYKLSQVVGENDSVIIYFAGHGHTESLIGGGKEGYIIPVEANTEDSFLSAISMHQLKSITKRIKAKHILFLMDSCYSGMGFTRSAGISKSENQYINKIMSYRAVQMITAGGMNEQVLEQNGHGVFTKSLLDGLNGKADLDKDGYITASELGTFIRPEVSKKSDYKQTPNFGRFEGEGEYVFRLNGDNK